jgi:uncharacterized protein
VDVTAEKLVETMTRPSFYPHHPDMVELIQTHISYIFLAGEYVYKVKKPVDFGFLDFTTLEKRRHFCGEELRLNQRLAPQLYLAVVPITRSALGGLELAGPGDPVEYAVKMRRLPEERMLKRLLAEGKAEPAIMDAVADKLASFHAAAETGGEVDAIGGVEAVIANWDENFVQTEPFVGRTVSAADHAFLRDYVSSFVTRRRSLLESRVAKHRVRDCHGDVHLEHVCVLDDGIAIFDCIEFNQRFRYSDVASEVAFLAMDLDFNGYQGFAERFVRAYQMASGDEELGRLVPFYKCYRAYVRGKVIGFRLDDPAIDATAKGEAAAAAGRYFQLARGYAARFEEPTLVLMCGLMGAGKSVLATALAGEVGAEQIRTDVVRKELQLIDPSEHRFEEFGRGIYSPEVSRLTYQEALDRAAERLRAGASVIIDGSYQRRAERLNAARVAQALGVAFVVIECTCPEDTVRRRLDARLTQAGEPSDGRWDLFHEQKAGFEPVDEVPPRHHLVIVCAGTTNDSVAETLRALAAMAHDRG